MTVVGHAAAADAKIDGVDAFTLTRASSNFGGPNVAFASFEAEKLRKVDLSRRLWCVSLR